MKLPWQKEQPKSQVDDKHESQEPTRAAKPKRDARGRYLKGYSGNPEGGPVGKTWKSTFNAILDCVDPDADMRYRELLACAIIGQALGKGGGTQQQIILERTEGRVSQDVNLGGTDKPLVLKIVRDDGSSAGSSAEGLP